VSDYLTHHFPAGRTIANSNDGRKQLKRIQLIQLKKKCRSIWRTAKRIINSMLHWKEVKPR
jgi:hypothetical protein